MVDPRVCQAAGKRRGLAPAFGVQGEVFAADEALPVAVGRRVADKDQAHAARTAGP